MVVIPLTTEDIENIEPFEVLIKNIPGTRLDYPSKLQFNYPRTVDRERLKGYLGVVSGKRIGELKRAWKVAFDSENIEDELDEMAAIQAFEILTAAIISNNHQNQFSPVVTVLPITYQLDKVYPFEILINLDKPSKILLDQIITIDKIYVKEKIASLTTKELMVIERKLHITLGLPCYREVNLEELDLGNNEFTGSLEFTKNMDKLEKLSIYGTNLTTVTHPELMKKAGKEPIVLSYDGEIKLEKVTTAPEFLQEELEKELIFFENYHPPLNYSDFLLRDGNVQEKSNELTVEQKQELDKVTSQLCINQNSPEDKSQEVPKMRQYYSHSDATLIAIDEEIGNENDYSLGSSSLQLEDNTRQISITPLVFITPLAVKHRQQTVPVDGIYAILGLLPYGDKVKTNYKHFGQEYTKEDLEKSLLPVVKEAIQQGTIKTILQIQVGDNLVVIGEKGVIEYIVILIPNNTVHSIGLVELQTDEKPTSKEIFADLVNRRIICGRESISHYQELLKDKDKQLELTTFLE
ncbi:5416_t:CDS:10 [Ambispora gerdemannii]|uniref:5416_t:CDS:1 n=1 Tax=Ambispora gerdemannii TaxID=144530 RepID=A0A9N9FHB3_9GLOM|nr:5416_t:CDS:10 [Ambispora gerdemannii]